VEPRERLLSLLREEYPAEHACADALRDGSGMLAWQTEHLGSADVLAEIYTRRAKHLDSYGIREIGADDFPRLILESGDERVALLSVHSPTWNFVVALTADRSAVLCATAVDAAVANPEWDWAASHPD
jgi:hypothetical protein